MNKIITVVGLLLLVPFLPVRAQEHKRVSPHETVSATIDGANIKIVYGRPYTRDPKTKEMRKIWGGLVPFGQVWRMGADEATMLTTDHDIAIGGTAIPAGSYTLFLQPEENGPAKLIVNKQTGQWGNEVRRQPGFRPHRHAAEPARHRRGPVHDHDRQGRNQQRWHPAPEMGAVHLFRTHHRVKVIAARLHRKRSRGTVNFACLSAAAIQSGVMNEQQLVKDAYADVIKALFATFVDNWTAAKGANDAPGVADAEGAYSKGLQLRKDALAKALSLTP